MSFLHPALALAGIAAIAIPILIHLLMRRRRKPVMWAAMRFLLEAYRQHKRRLKLEQILLLAARCLVVALIGLALARPLLSQAAALGRGATSAYLLIDNSLTGSADGDGGTALERHKARALEVLAQLDPGVGDRAAVITLAGPAEPLVSPPSSDIAAVRSLVESIRSTDSAADIPGAIARLGDEIASDEGHASVIVLSDFLTGSGDTERSLPPVAARERLSLLAAPPSETGVDNISIVAVEPLRSVILASPRSGTPQQTQVRVTLRRTGPFVTQPAVSKVRVRLDAGREGIAAGEAVVNWTSGQAEATGAVPITFPADESMLGSGVLTAQIDSDAIAGDNTRRRPIELRDSLHVGIIAPRRFGGGGAVGQFDPADWFELALQPETTREGDAPIQISSFDPAAIDAPRLAGLDAVILTRPDALPADAWPRLRAFADAGGLVVVSPPPEATVHLWPDALLGAMDMPWQVGREPRDFDPPAPLASDRPRPPTDLLALIASELPDLVRPVGVRRVLPVEVPPASADRQLDLADGTPLLLAARPAPDVSGESRGLVVLLASAVTFDWTDLAAKPLMVPFVQEVVRQGVGRARGSWSSIAGQIPHIPARTVELRPIVVEEARPILVDAAGQPSAPIRDAGLWRALDDAGGERGLIAINADTAAGRTDPQPPGLIQSWLSSAAPGVEVRWLADPGDPSRSVPIRASADRHHAEATVSVSLLVAALIVALAELCMARWFSHARISPGAGAAA